MAPASAIDATLTLLERALDETRAVEQLIEQGDWQRAVERDAARQHLLLEAFRQGTPGAFDAATRALAAELLAHNDRVVGLAEHRRRGVERESDTLQLGRRAAAAYHQVHFDPSRS